MSWPNAYRLPKWILTTTAASMLALPVVAQAQSGLSAATGKPSVTPVVKPVSRTKSRTAAPAVPPADEELAVAPTATPAVMAQRASTDGESAVQKELRRMYQESGREAPEVPTPAQLQSINGRTSVAPVPAPTVAPYGTYGAAPPRTTAEAPAPSAPARTSRRNPVTAFFQKITGRDSKPVNHTAAAGTTGPVTNPTIPMRQAPPPARNYAPYQGTQPQRLNASAPQNPPAVATTPPAPAAPVVQAPAAVAARPAARPAKPVPPPVQSIPQQPSVNLAERLQLDKDTPVVTAPAQVRAEIIATPQAPITPVVTGPRTTESFTARTSPEPEPVFEEPVIVSAESDSPFEAPMEVSLGSEAPMPTAEAMVAAVDQANDFPAPFPEEDEEEADEEAMESPFSGLSLDDEQPIIAETIPAEAVPLTDSVAEPAPLTVPEASTVAVPAPASTTVELEEPAPVATTPMEEDAEFFPADVAKPAIPAENGDVPALAFPEATPSTAPAATTPAPQTDEYAAKMQKIKERGGMKGLKGFCPVTLRDERELKDAKPEFHSQFRGQKFHFASEEAKVKFEQASANYAPAAYGADVVVLIRDKDVAEGTLDFAAWYKGQLYLFSSEETHTVFTNDPAKFATPVGIE